MLVGPAQRRPRPASTWSAPTAAGLARSWSRSGCAPSLPSLFAALRIAAPAAVLGAIIGEYLGGDRGLGVAMINSEQSLDIARTWGIAFVATAVGAVGYGLMALVGRLLTPWAQADVMTVLDAAESLAPAIARGRDAGSRRPAAPVPALAAGLLSAVITVGRDPRAPGSCSSRRSTCRRSSARPRSTSGATCSPHLRPAPIATRLVHESGTTLRDAVARLGRRHRRRRRLSRSSFNLWRAAASDLHAAWPWCCARCPWWP